MYFWVNFLYNNFLFLFLFVGFVVVLAKKRYIKDVHMGYMWATIICLVILVFTESIEVYVAGFPEWEKMRIFLSVAAYWMRPACALGLVLFVNDDRRLNLVLSIPEFINIIVMSLAFVTPLVFYFDDNYKFVRGPLGYTVFVIGFLYILILLVITYRKYVSGRVGESAILLVCAVACVVATIMEAFHGGEVLAPAILLSCIFYYMFVRFQDSDKDALTKLYNRQTFYEDCIKYDKAIRAIASIDMNGLKQINDGAGHEYGDKALITIADCMRASMNKNVFAYRMGGDEFVLIFLNQNDATVTLILNKIQQDVIAAGYAIAVGHAYRADNEPTDILCKISDKRMYEDKRNYYKETGNDRRSS